MRVRRDASRTARVPRAAAPLTPRLPPLSKDLNEYFKSIMEGLSAKVFRTYNASITLCSELQKTADQVTKAKIAKEGYVEAHCEWYHIANNPNEPKYLKIKQENAKFNAKLGGLTGGRECILATGFVDNGEGSFELTKSKAAWDKLVASKDSIQITLNALGPAAAPATERCATGRVGPRPGHCRR